MTLRSHCGKGRGVFPAAEWDLIIGTTEAWAGEPVTPLIYCHGAGDGAATAYDKSAQRPLIRGLAEHFLVSVADLGLAAWGSDTHVTRIEEQVTNFGFVGHTGPFVLVGGSMGMLGALGYALAHPENVAAVAGVIPALDIADVYAQQTAPIRADIDAAYGGAYSDVVHGPDHSPVQYAADLDPDIPIGIWAADNDTKTRPGPVNAFVAARPATDVTWVGNLEHTEAAIAAATDSLVAWLLTAV